MRQCGKSSATVRPRRLGRSAKRGIIGSGPGPASRYLRHRDLPRLLPVFAEELDTASVADHARLVALLRRALRIERRRGVAGDWSYDLARHANLLEAYRLELEALNARRRGVSPPADPGRD